MSTAWVAVGVRSTAMKRRRIGREATRRLAASESLEAALATLVAGPYGHEVRVGQSLAEAQRAVVASMVWNLRVLAGWAPRPGVLMLRAFAATIEIANIDDHLQALAGATAPSPYVLGALSTAWPRLARASNAADLRTALAASRWGDPGSDDPHDIAVYLRLSLAGRVLTDIPLARAWSAGAAALVLAREVAFHQPALPDRVRRTASRTVGLSAAAAGSLPELAARLPIDARWALADVAEPDDLWRAEMAWWQRVERDASALTKRGVTASDVVLGATAMLAVDAWRVRAALEVAARGNGRSEDFDAVA